MAVRRANWNLNKSRFYDDTVFSIMAVTAHGSRSDELSKNKKDISGRKKGKKEGRWDEVKVGAGKTY